METKSIEERAKAAIQNACDKCMFRKACTQHCNDYNRYIGVCKKALTEQDRIARAEERERCIRLAQIHSCKFICMNFSCNLVLENDMCRINNCDTLKSLRKAIEEGGKENER